MMSPNNDYYFNEPNFGKFIGKPLNVLLRVFGFSRKSTMLFLDSEAGTKKLGEEYDVRRLVKKNMGYSEFLIKDISIYCGHKKITITSRSRFNGKS